MISIRLDEAMENQLSFLSKERTISKSQIIKEALKNYFDLIKKESQQKTSYELGSALFGNYGSEDGTMSVTYKQKLKDKLNAKNTH